MAEQIKFTEEEMNSLTSLQSELNDIILQLGQLNIEEINIKAATDRLIEARTNLVNSYSELQKRERALAASLNSKYGPGILDPKTGVFTPSAEQTQS